MRVLRLLPLLALTGLVLVAAPARSGRPAAAAAAQDGGRPTSSTSTSPRGG